MNSISALLKSTDSFHPLYCSMSQQHMALVTLPLPQTGCLSDTAPSPWPPSPGQVLLSPLQAHSSIWSWGSGGLGLSQVLLLSWWWWFSCQVVSDSCDPWTGARQAPLSLGFSRQEYWSGWPFPPLLAFLLYSYWGKHFIHYLFSRNSENLSPALSPSTRSSRPIVWFSPKLMCQK